MKRKLFLLLCALLTMIGVQNVKADVDFTNAFGNANANWTGNTGVEKNATPQCGDVVMSECYYGSYGTGFAMKQTAFVPNGNYVVEVYAQAHHAWLSNFTPSTMTNVNTLSVNTSNKAVPTVDNTGFTGSEPTLYTFDNVAVTDGTMTITLNRDAQGANWFTMNVKSVKLKTTATDETVRLTNPDFSAGTWSSGWTGTGNDKANAFVNQTNASFNGTFAEMWVPKSTSMAAGNLNQTVTLPAGVYTLYAKVQAGLTCYLYASIGDVEQKHACFGSISMQALTFVVPNNDTSVKIGLRHDGITDPSAAVWIAVDNFKLARHGDVDEADLTSKIANPSFSSAYTNGWTLDGTAPNAYNSTYGTYEAYHLVGGLHQDITGLPNGVYKVTMQASERVDGGSHAFNLYATTSSGTTKSTATVASHTNFNTMAQTMYNDPTYARIETYAVVTDGNLTIGHYESNNNTWPVFDNYTLTYCGNDANAYALALTSEAAKANAVISALDNGSIKTAMSASYASHNAEATLANIQWMSFVASSVTELNDANKCSIGAESIADVEYEETTSGSHATFAEAISTFTTSVSNATATAAVTTAISTMKAAIKTYVNAAEPKNEGEYFDITCLIKNPTFENNYATGWSGTTPNAITYGCAEFFNMNFDFYQNITGLANGSYQLSVQAYCRPGDNGDTSAGAYYDYTKGINNITAELYVNSDESTIGNIYSYKDNTTGAKVVGNDFHCNISPDDYWVPNNMQGASLYFADNAYNTTVAALVEDGNLKIGFREASKKNNQWVIFDNFRLYYYGSSKLVYYQQYLPQLKAEVTSDLANAAYDNVTGKERGDLETAKAATPASETEEAYKAVIDDIKEKQAAFKDAKTAYDALVTAKAASVITKISENIGAGVFQYNATTNNTLYSAYETCKDAVDDYTVTSSSTASAVQTLVDALNEAIDDYNNQPLKAPAPDTRYYLTIVEDGKDWNGKAVTFIAGGRKDQGSYAIKYNTTPNDPNKCQALKFTAVAGEANTYKVSAVNLSGGEQYLTTGTTYGGNNDQIRTTDDASKAMKIKIEATSTENQFQLRNVAANKIIANNNNDDMYTANSCNFTIAEASQAKPNLTVVADVNWATFMSPFAVDLSSLSSVEAYTVTDVDEGVTVMSDVSEGIIPANTPVLLYRATTGSNYKPVLSGWGTAAANTYVEGLLTGSYVIDDVPVNSYALQKQNNKVGFYKVTSSGIKVGVNRAYLTLPAETPAREAFFFEEDVTGINTIGEKAANTLQDLLNGADVYDLSGRKVNGPLEKGKVYIVNGNKIYVK